MDEKDLIKRIDIKPIIKNLSLFNHISITLIDESKIAQNISSSMEYNLKKSLENIPNVSKVEY
ncbi:MAG: hypothetical protein COA88_09295 [Kordia sp.]|nr:MAG: hypothetical protein COA88_09295 [Kordia sp.]